ncbi:MAG TPA: MFS transporter [Gaiellaceae bacterium]|nr:MFS transporter [Gaiellaceae bacterium]
MRYRWAVLAAGTAAATSGSAFFIGIPVLAPTLRDEFDLTLSQVGFALASLWVGALLTLLPWGLLADRLGERVVLSTGTAACGILAAAAGWAPSFVVLVALLFLASAMGASVNAASGRAVMQWFSVEERGFALGIRQTAIPLGAAVGALTLPLVEHAGGLKAAFTYLGALSVGAAIVAALVIREAPTIDKELEGDAIPWTLRDHRLWTLCAGSGLYLFGQLPLMSFTVLFLHDVYGVSDARAAVVLAVFQVGAVFSRIGAGRLSDRIGSRLRPLRWIGLASASGLLLTAAFARSSLIVVVVVIVVAGTISMAWNGLSLTAAAELAGRARSGAAIGFQQTTLSLIGVVIPVAFAAVVEAASWRAAFALSALGPLVGWWLLGRLPERVEQRAPAATLSRSS